MKTRKTLTIFVYLQLDNTRMFFGTLLLLAGWKLKIKTCYIVMGNNINVKIYIFGAIHTLVQFLQLNYVCGKMKDHEIPDK